MEKDELYWNAFWNIFGGIAMFGIFTLLPLSIISVAPGKFHDADEMLFFFGVATVFLSCSAFLLSKMTVCLAATATDGRADRLERVAKLGETIRLYGNPIGLISVLMMKASELFVDLITLSKLIRSTQDPDPSEERVPNAD
jgi:hypothetical protein